MANSDISAGISVVTLAVDDLSIASAFYEALGWELAPQSQETIKFLQGNNMVLSLFSNDSVAEVFDAEFEPAEFPAVVLAVNLATEEDVDQFFRTAIDAGGDAVRKPDRTYWGGYSGYFKDPDEHMWEVAHNPFFKFNENGNIDLLSDANE